jgi:phospholipid transport system transporter-binding protein
MVTSNGGEAAAVSLPERLTIQEAAQTMDRLVKAFKQESGPVVTLDASAMRVFDSSAVALLLELRSLLLAQGKTLNVTAWPKRLRDLVGLYGVSELLPA